ncbi:MAG: DNA polymerase III subunit delta [Phocaeicola sp.]|nr:DNA polymerase III subunit delta [Phocaeicola sp.]
MAKELTYLDILADLRNKHYKPVYYLMGEEAYFIDLIADFIEENVLTEAEKGFNQTIMYGADVDIATIINSAKRYPMMSDYQVIIVREAQAVKNMDELVYYLQKPLNSTILVLCHKHGILDRRKKLAAEIQKVGVLFESKRLRDYQLPDFISNYLRQQKVDIEAKAAEMMADFVGTDLSRMVGELEKLIITLPKGQRRITPLQIEQNIGISKDYNNFELRNAIIQKDVEKANKIVKYFAENPKTNPIQLTLVVLFNFFSNLMLAYYAPVKTEEGVAAQLGLRSSWQAKDYVAAMRMYSGIKVMQIISDIRMFDARSKGVDNSSVSDADLLKELVYRILH